MTSRGSEINKIIDKLCEGKDDDYKTFKMIYAIAELFPVNDKYYRNEPKAEQHLKELWYLYFFFKESIDGNKVKYSNIVAKYC